MNRPHYAGATRPVVARVRLACALGAMLGACTEPHFAAEPAATDRLQFEETPSGGSLEQEAPTLSLEACIERHIAQAGRASDVKVLACPGRAGMCKTAPDLTPLASLTSLTILNLSDRCIRDVAPIARLTRLAELELAGNWIGEIRPLGNLRDLRTLGLANNPLQATWLFKTKQPFSQFTQLEELDLDGTFIGNIIPLETLTSLKVLSLRDCALVGLRPLRTLANLRELRLDRNDVWDVSDLEHLSQLQQLTARDNAISSAAPLERLARRGQLREVALDNNCVTSCPPVGGAVFSCTEPGVACRSREQAIPASALSVPVDALDDFVPDVDFPIWTQDQVERAFELVRSGVRVDHVREGCQWRATAAEAITTAAGFPAMTRVFAFGNLRPLTSVDPAGFVSFDWHVAAAVRTAEGFVVFDPALAPRPLALRDWYARLVDSKGVKGLDFSCASYNGESTRLDVACGAARGVEVDAQGLLVVDDLRDVRGTICASSNCDL